MPNYLPIVGVVIYVLGMAADYIDSRRSYLSRGKSLLIAPFWPILFAIEALLALIRLPRR